MFIDKATIHIKAGNGGDGAVAFHREKFVASGGPDGGDGGRGGNVVFVVDEGMNTLSDYRHKRKYHAENGLPGGGKRCSGKAGADVVLKVPRGTLVYDDETGRLMADLSGKEPVVLAKGGNGGWGNSHFATPTRQTPRFAKPGIPGEEFTVRLELKLLADVGLVGFPNVGKSTLVSVVSEAKPQIANYHFTTITPVLGVVRVGEASFVMADIPGLIEGAGEGVGLGHEFLRHVERCRLLVHIVDVAGSEGRDPLADFDTINKELETFNPELAKLPMLVAGNKCDLATDEQLEAFAAEMEKRGYRYFPMMAPISHGTDELINACAATLATLPPIRAFEPEAPVQADADSFKDRSVTVTKTDDGVYSVEGKWLLTVMRGINFDDYEALQYFERVLKAAGVIDALRDAGVQEGDTVCLYDFEFEFVN